MTKHYKLSEDQVQQIEAALGRLDEVAAEVEAVKNAGLSDEDLQTISDSVGRQMRAAQMEGDGKRRSFEPGGGEGQDDIDPGLGDLDTAEAARIYLGHQVRQSMVRQLGARGVKTGFTGTDPDLERAYNSINQRAAERRADRLYAPGQQRSNAGDPEFTECGVDFLWDLVCQGTPLAEMIPSRPTRHGRLKWRVFSNLFEAWGVNPTQDCSGVKCTPTSTANLDHDEQPAKVFKIAACFNRTDAEDAYWDIVGEFVDKMVADARRVREQAFIRGDMTIDPDTTNLNHYGQPLASPSANTVPAYAHWDGLQHAYLVDNPANNGNLVYWDETAGPAAEAPTPAGWFTTGNQMTYSDFQRLRQLMVDPLLNRALGFCGDLVALVTPGLYGYLLTLPEWSGGCCGDGPAVTGRVPSLSGTPVHWSEHMPMTDAYGRVQMSAPGVPDPSANLYHSLMLVHLRSFLRGEADGFEVNVEIDNDCEKIKPILRWREAFGRHSSSADPGGIEGVAGLHGISLTPQP